MPSIFLWGLLRDLLSPECTFKKLKQAVFWFNLCVRSSFPNPMTLYTGFTNNRMVGWAANHSSKRLLPLPAVQRATRPTLLPGKSVQNYLQEPETGRKDQVLAIHELDFCKKKGPCFLSELHLGPWWSLLADLKLVLIRIIVSTEEKAAWAGLRLASPPLFSPSTAVGSGTAQMCAWPPRVQPRGEGASRTSRIR